jgi:hypothetical protein
MQEDFKDLDAFFKKNLEEESTSSDFTNMVLGQIHANQTKKEKALQILLQKNMKVIPSEGFTTNVMQQVLKHAEVTKYRPVISKKTWIVIAIVLAILTCFIAIDVDMSKEESSVLYRYLANMESLYTFEVPYFLISPVFALGLFALSSLLSIDYFLRNKSYL